MTYNDAKEFLRIAENAFAVEAYCEAAEIVEKVVRAVAFDNDDMTTIHHDEIVKCLKQLIARFSFCPNECCWEEMTSLSDLLREK